MARTPDNMSGRPSRSVLPTAALLAVTLLTAPAARGQDGSTFIRDIAHLQGIRTNELTAVSLVVGLAGTGDGKIGQSILALQGLLAHHDMGEVPLSGLNGANVALVQVAVTVPEHGARDGERLDVKVSSLNGAKSLKGGRLVQCPLLGPMATPRPGALAYGLASGEVVLEDPDSPTVGVVKGGAVMEADIRPVYLQQGRITLVLDREHATFAIASAIAKVVNDAEADLGKTLAVADGPGQVVVQIPPAELAAPADFISRILDLPVLMPDLKARIVINRRTGTIVITADVRIDPVVFALRGLTINTLTPPPAPTPEQPRVDVKRFQLFAPKAARAGTSAQQLVDAFNLLQVPLEDQIAVIWELKRAGRLHAEVIEN